MGFLILFHFGWSTGEFPILGEAPFVEFWKVSLCGTAYYLNFNFMSRAHFKDGGMNTVIYLYWVIWICFCRFIISVHNFSYL